MNRFQAWYRAQPKALRALLTVNAVIYVVWVLLLSNIEPTFHFVRDHLALNPALPGLLVEPWQLITYNFLHIAPGFWGFIHILFNLLWLYWIGRDHEDLHGPHALLALYLITGLGGGLLTVVLHAAFPGVGAFGGPVHGASASVLGIMTAVAVMYPYKKIALLIIGTVRLIYVVLAFLVLDLLFLAGSGTAVGAHLGGALTGFLFVRAEQKGADLTSWARFFFRDRRRRTAAPVTPERSGLLGRLEAWLASRSSAPPEAGTAGGGRRASKSPLARLRTLQVSEAEPDLPASEIDRILDKISEQGMESLTEEERRVLHEASRK